MNGLSNLLAEIKKLFPDGSTAQLSNLDNISRIIGLMEKFVDVAQAHQASIEGLQKFRDRQIEINGQMISLFKDIAKVIR